MTNVVLVFTTCVHSLASFLVRSKTDPKTVQALLRHSDVKTTLQLYAQQTVRNYSCVRRP
jgi:site-specific recombinase XerD